MESEGWNGEVWDAEKLAEYVQARPGRCVVVIDGYAVDVTKYMGEHVRSFHTNIIMPPRLNFLLLTDYRCSPEARRCCVSTPRALARVTRRRKARRR